MKEAGKMIKKVDSVQCIGCQLTNATKVNGIQICQKDQEPTIGCKLTAELSRRYTKDSGEMEKETDGEHFTIMQDAKWRVVSRKISKKDYSIYKINMEKDISNFSLMISPY